MGILHARIKRPGVAFGVIFGLSALVAQYGVVEAGTTLFLVFGGIAIYRMIVGRD